MRKVLLTTLAALSCAAMLLLPAEASAGGGRGRSGGSSRSPSARSHSPRSTAPRSSARSSRGYYRGPSKPSGTYKGGSGSSHKGGHYRNPGTGDRYQKRK